MLLGAPPSVGAAYILLSLTGYAADPGAGWLSPLLTRLPRFVAAPRLGTSGTWRPASSWAVRFALLG